MIAGTRNRLIRQGHRRPDERMAELAHQVRMVAGPAIILTCSSMRRGCDEERAMSEVPPSRIPASPRIPPFIPRRDAAQRDHCVTIRGGNGCSRPPDSPTGQTGGRRWHPGAVRATTQGRAIPHSTRNSGADGRSRIPVGKSITQNRCPPAVAGRKAVLRSR